MWLGSSYYHQEPYKRTIVTPYHQEPYKRTAMSPSDDGLLTEGDKMGHRSRGAV